MERQQQIDDQVFEDQLKVKQLTRQIWFNASITRMNQQLEQYRGLIAACAVWKEGLRERFSRGIQLE